MTTLELWNKCQLLSWGKPEVDKWIKTIEINKHRYDVISEKTKLPFWLIGAIHGREASFNFSTHLHNGDPLNHATVHVPSGRGPFASWELSAIDALEMKHPEKYDFSRIEVCLDFAEKYNGMGYRKMDVRSPYVWGLTDMQQPGKYIRDHIFDATVVNKRPGIAAIALHFVERQSSVVVP